MIHHNLAPKLLFWALLAPTLVTVEGFTCAETTGDTRLSSLEIEVEGVNRVSLNPELRVYDLWLPAGATQATVRAVPMDLDARVTWYVPDGAGMLASGTFGVGGGEITTDLPPDGYALYLAVYPPGGAFNDYILNVNPPCPQGDACSNGNLFSSTCQSGVCSNTCVATGPEICDGRDNDCNGIPDDDIAGFITGTDVGECQTGIDQCVGGIFVNVQAEVRPGLEQCDGLDNDCTGVADDGIADLITGIDTGACEPEVQSCINGSFVITQFAVGPSPEICDGLDNDCNATSDDNIADITTGTNVGECQEGLESCIGGTFTVVQAGIGPAVEQCDSLDNDCDGAADDGIADIVMGTNVGECRRTIQSCVGGTLTVVQAGIGPATEVCDGLDNNCNGITDDSASCNPINQVALGLCPNFRCSNLDGQDLRQVSLDCADFTDASLRGANLAGADLSFANFNGANLSDANLSGADVRNATFLGADLSFADLFGADIGNADFTGADLTGAR